jgi:hypothetical protein
MAQALDYSAGFPGAQAIANAGYSGAIRYIGRPGNRKNTTAGELADFTARGLGMALIFESTTDNWKGGRAQGRADARDARDHATVIGFPQSRPIYLAVDRDVVTAADFETALDYLRGANSVLGASLTGVYGEADLIDRARDAGVASWFWQTVAWSRGRRTSAHLFQRLGTVYVGGIGCDVNDILVADWGQHNVKGEDMSWEESSGVASPSDPTHVYTMKEMVVGSNKADWDVIVPLLHRLDVQVSGLQNTLDENQVATLAAIAAVQNGVATDAQVEHLGNQLLAVLPEGIAQKLGEKLLRPNTTAEETHDLQP